MTQFNAFFVCYPYTFLNNFAMQFIVSRIGNVLLLYSRVNSTCIFIAIITINADTFFENQFNAFLSNAFPEMNQFRSFTRFFGSKTLLSTEILIVGIFPPLLNHALIT